MGFCEAREAEHFSRLHYVHSENIAINLLCNDVLQVSLNVS